jgi:hypothetical protein
LAEWGSKVSASVALAQRSTFSAAAGEGATAARIHQCAANRLKPLYHPGLPTRQKAERGPVPIGPGTSVTR